MPQGSAAVKAAGLQEMKIGPGSGTSTLDPTGVKKKTKKKRRRKTATKKASGEKDEV